MGSIGIQTWIHPRPLERVAWEDSHPHTSDDPLGYYASKILNDIIILYIILNPILMVLIWQQQR